MVSLPQSWRRPLPWIFLSLGAAALVIQLNPAWRDPLLYERLPLARGEIWRAWTGHFVHFGWPHFIADTGLFLLLGWLLQARHPRFSALALALLPVFISAVLYWFDPAMTRYGGLSALNLGLLLYLAAQGWQRNWADWFWPAVLLIYVGEIIFELMHGGHGGGLIRFDDSTIQVATSAHLASAGYALLAWLAAASWAKKRPEPAGSGR
ncbi:MAG: rhombosortase [Lacunisphaera sp.]|jgi:rhomboid family GlyGly-CTERM serine protease|nr:rhombosortase [Lacunisphaera sp.]